MNPAIPIIEGVNNDEAESAEGSGNDRVDRTLKKTIGHLHPTCHQARYILWLGTNEMHVLSKVTRGFSDKICSRRRE